MRVSDLITEDVFSLPVLGEENTFLNKSERKKELKRDGSITEGWDHFIFDEV